MYPRKLNQFLKFRAVGLFTIWATLAGVQQCVADSGVSATAVAAKSAKTISLSASLTRLPSVNNLKRHPVKGVEVYEYDATPIDGRAPLLLVHGLDGENKDCFRWRQVCEELAKDKALKSKYKILLARYNTHVPLATVVPEFKRAVAEISPLFGGKQITMLALSMGGNVIQQSLTDDKTTARVDRVLTMGTPFHGSPLFASDWMRYSMAKRYRLPLMRLDNCLPYKIYFDRHRNLLADLPWDNVDKRIPDVGNFRFIFPYIISGDLTPSGSGNPELIKFNSGGTVDKAKFITYGGYLDTELTNPKRDHFVFSALHYPAWLMFTKVPEHCGLEHPVLRVLNIQIAQAITDKTGISSGISGKIYGLNDGITPLASALYLPDSALSERSFTTPADVDLIHQYVDVRKARVFGNIDHLTFIDGYRPHGSSALLKDELAPGAPERTIFRWIVTDLMDTPEGQIAEGTPKADPEGRMKN